MTYNSEVKLEFVSKQLGDFSLKNIDLFAKPNEIIGIIGENGAGKTTLLRIIGKLLKSDSGNTFIPPKEDIGFVFDNNHLPEEINSKEVNTIMYYIFSTWDSTVFFNYIDEFKLPINKRIKNFSKGMKTKINIAVALSHSPKVLLLDEITSGLDPLVKEDILKVVKNYIKSNKAIAIMTTHLLDDIIKIADKVIVLDNGKILLNENVSHFENTQSLEMEFKKIIYRE